MLGQKRFSRLIAQNYKQLKALPVKLFYKQLGILFRQVKLVIKKTLRVILERMAFPYGTQKRVR